MTAPVKIAITGLGFTHSMLPGYLACPDTTLTLLHDIDEARAKKISEECGGVPWTTDFAQLLKCDADIVEIGTPNHLHAEQAAACMQAGKHVLIEKPLASSVPECRAIAEAAKATGRRVGVNMTLLNMPFHHSLRAMHAKGLFGQIGNLRIRLAHRGPLKRTDGNHWRFKKSNIGGGSFMQLGIHPMNCALWIAADAIERVSCFAKNLYCQHSLEGEDTLVASAELKSGALMALESAYNSVGSCMAIYGTEGHAVVENGAMWLEAKEAYKDEWLEYPGPDRKPGETVFYAPDSKLVAREKSKGSAQFPHTQHLAFARAVRDGAPFEMDAEAGLRDVACIQAMYRAAEERRIVDVKELLA
ncbi:MAG: Gfo/Idh/MocA family oxidoreductase [Planctomycetota bacterium]|nr:Gfo/Idh/MocA family oxidoreductase [Planctomycetota bacterium]